MEHVFIYIQVFNGNKKLNIREDINNSFFLLCCPDKLSDDEIFTINYIHRVK